MKKVSLGLLSIMTAVSLHAVEQPNIGDVIKEVKPPKIEKKKEILPPLKMEDEEYKKTFKEGKKILVKRFLISGAAHMSQAELKTIVQSYEGKELSFNEMQKIASLITKAYQDKGYFVARAYIPVQNIQQQDNVLKIMVIEGEYSEFKLENNSLVKDSTVQANLDEIKKAKVISSNSLQRGLLIINDMSGVSIKDIKIASGKEMGTSSFVVTTKPSEQYNGYVIVDNHGSKYTGRNRVLAGIDINSPFKIGDKISLSALSSDTAGLLNGRVAYDFPLSSDGLRGEVSYSKTTYELGSNYDSLDALGYANSVVGKLSYPYILSNTQKLETYFTASYNEMKDEIQATSTTLAKETVVAKLGLDYLKDSLLFDKYTQIKVSPSLSLGRVSFQEEADKQNDENGANTNGRFSKVNLDLEGNIAFNEKLRLENSLQLQYALGDKNLDGSEDLSTGGTNGVKLYPSGEESAENGYIFSTELIYALPSFKNLNSQVGVFYDNARVYMSKDTTNDKSRTLQDIGLSYYGSYDDFFLNSYLAYKVGGAKVTSEDEYKSRFMVQAGWVF